MRAHERRFEKAQFEWYRELKTQSARLKENTLGRVIYVVLVPSFKF